MIPSKSAVEFVALHLRSNESQGRMHGIILERSGLHEAATSAFSQADDYQQVAQMLEELSANLGASPKKRKRK